MEDVRPLALADASAWAAAQFGAAALGDRRRTRRLVQVAAAMARDSSGTIPQQMGAPAAMKATYRLFAADDVTHAAVCAPHFAQTRAAATRPLVFLVQDTAELNFATHIRCEGLGPIGAGHLRGLHQQNVLAVDPISRRPLGLLYQKHHRWTRRGAGHRRSDKRRVPLAERASHWWIEAIRTIGPPPDGVRWVHVGDRAEDLFGVYHEARQQRCDWLIRAAYDRNVRTAAGAGKLFEIARRLPARSTHRFALRCQTLGALRDVELHLAATTVTLPPTYREAAYRDCADVTCQVVRIWEPHPPPEIAPLEWILLTSLPCTGEAELQFAAQGYALRWLIEEFHKCEKTGCQVEMRRLEHTDRLEPLIGLLSVLAVFLLQLKFAVRDAPQQLARDAVSEEHAHVMALYLQCTAETLTVEQFWRGIGRLGGHPGRKADGPLGWLRAWKGWQAFQLITLGAKLKEKCG